MQSAGGIAHGRPARTRVLFLNTATLPPLGADTWIHAQIMRHLDRTHERGRRLRLGPADEPTPTYGCFGTIPDLELVPCDLGPELGRHIGARQGARRSSRRVPAVSTIVRLVVLSCAAGHRRSSTPATAPATPSSPSCSAGSTPAPQHRPRPRHVQPVLDGLDAAVVAAPRRRAHRRLGLRRRARSPTAASTERGPRRPQRHRRRRWVPGAAGRDPRGARDRPHDAPVARHGLPAVPGEGSGRGHRGGRPAAGRVPRHRAADRRHRRHAGRWFAASLRRSGRRARPRATTSCSSAGGATSRRCMAAGDVFAMPSFEEPFGLVFCEAMAMGMPVVALADGGTLEVVEHGRTGLLSERGRRRCAGRATCAPCCAIRRGGRRWVRRAAAGRRSGSRSQRMAAEGERVYPADSVLPRSSTRRAARTREFMHARSCRPPMSRVPAGARRGRLRHHPRRGVQGRGCPSWPPSLTGEYERLRRRASCSRAAAR